MRKNQTFRFLFFGFLVALLCVPTAVFSATSVGLSIEQGQSRTTVRRVALTIRPPKDARSMKVSNDADFRGADWRVIDRHIFWTLDYGSGVKRVFVKFRDARGRESGTYSDTIFLSAPRSFEKTFEINGNDPKTRDRYVTLTFDTSEGIETIEVSNASNFSDSEIFYPIDNLSWILTPGSGKKTVYVRFEDINGDKTVLSKSIEYEQPPYFIEEGTLLKGQSETLYYMGVDGRIHPFLNLATYHSWYKDFSEVTYVSDSKLQEYTVGTPVCLRAGTWLVKFSHSPRVYAVEPGCRIRPIRSETEAFLWYGEHWQKRIIELNDVMRSFYRVNPITDFLSAEDEDQDGVDEDTESLYGTSDRKNDSDRDSISDYEEIYFWFSDPMDADTNDNGVNDGLEVRRGLSPVSSLPIGTLPEGVYVPPVGTAFLMSGKKTIYYQYGEEQTGTISDSSFKQYNAPKHFITNLPFPLEIKRSSSRNRENIKLHFTPNSFRGNSLKVL